VCSDEEIPADLLLLTSNEENGIVYIDTVNLDGETSLKVKRSHMKTYYNIQDPNIPKVKKNDKLDKDIEMVNTSLSGEDHIAEKLSCWEGRVVCQNPSRSLVDVCFNFSIYIFIVISFLLAVLWTFRVKTITPLG
jgi:hypothetical protein